MADVSDFFEDDISEENETQVADFGEGSDIAYNDPESFDTEDINSRGGPTLSDLQEEESSNESSSENPEDKFGFEILGVGADFNFLPLYYPDRFTVGKARDISGEADSCKGENLTLNKVKNFRIHVKGFFLYNRSLSDFHALCNHDESKVEVINGLLPGGGMECLIEDPEFGEIRGFDAKQRDWLIDYSLDLISTGKDDGTGSKGESGIISSLDDLENNIRGEDLDLQLDGEIDFE